MPRPKKAGLDYYYKDVHEWDDFAVIDLINEYGPIGYTVYEVVLSRVYENGYYLEIPLHQLAAFVVRTVGSRWVKDKESVMQVIKYCAEIGLFDSALLEQSVVTSAMIQQHYSQVTARSKADKSKYWLLKSVKKDDGAEAESAAETNESAAKTPEKTAKTQQSKENKIKQNKTKANKSKAAGEKPMPEKAAAAAPKEIEEAYETVTGRGLRQTDREALAEMYTVGADEEMILKAINEVGRRGCGEISSMRYFLPIVREEISGKKRKSASKGRMPETSETEEIERLLDAEWLAQINDYTPVPEDYYT